MSLLLRTIQSFPGGKTAEQLVHILDKDCDTLARQSVYSNLRELSERGQIRRNRTGQWRSTLFSNDPIKNSQSPEIFDQDVMSKDSLLASKAEFFVEKLIYDENRARTTVKSEVDSTKLMNY